MLSYRLLVISLFFAVFISVGCNNCHLLERTGRRCNNGSSVSNRHAHPGASESGEEETRHHEDRHGDKRGERHSERLGERHGDRHNDRHGHGHHSHGNEKPTHNKGNDTKADSWPGHSLSSNYSWNALRTRNNPSNPVNRNFELTTDVTTTESSNDIERFLVGRRKRSALWMNPGLFYNRAISRIGSISESSHDHEENEEEDEDENERSNENSRTSAVTKKVVHERASNLGAENSARHGHGSSHGSNSHGSGHSSGHGSGHNSGGHGGHSGQDSHNNRTPLFLVPQSTLKLKVT